MQSSAESHQRMRWPSSLATRLTALISVLKKEWNPPQCAMMKSPCTVSRHVRPNYACETQLAQPSRWHAPLGLI